MQIQLKDEDFRASEVENSDGFNYHLDMHKTARLIGFSKNAKEMPVECIWVDESAKGRYQNLEEGQEEKIKIIPAEFVRAKYILTGYYFDRFESWKNKTLINKLEANEQELRELQFEIGSHLIRLVRSLTHDLLDIEHIAETMENKLGLTIRNVADNNNDMFLPGSDLTQNGDWLHLTFSNNNYNLDEAALQENDNILYLMAIHKTLGQLIFARAASPEFKTTPIHHLYISKDDGLGRYKVQTNEGRISNQFFVPVSYVMDRCDRFRRLMDDFKKVQDESIDIYIRQAIWCRLQDDTIHIINCIIRELETDLKQEIEKSLNHHVTSLASSIRNPSSFDDFYNKVVEREKRIRLQLREETYPNNLVILNRRYRTIFVIHIDNLENDIFSMAEKIRIFVSQYDPDYYVMVSETWTPKDQQIQQRITANYRYGDIAKLSSHEKKENLMFIAKTKNSITRGPDKSEVYEIVREKQNDENSRIMDLRKVNNGGLDFGMEYHDWV